MTKSDEWAFWSIRRFEREREQHGNIPWPGYWSNCILNYTDYLRIVWC